MDQNLWASLAVRIYEGLAEEIVRHRNDDTETQPNRHAEKIIDLKKKIQSSEQSMAEAQERVRLLNQDIASYEETLNKAKGLLEAIHHLQT